MSDRFTNYSYYIFLLLSRLSVTLLDFLVVFSDAYRGLWFLGFEHQRIFYIIKNFYLRSICFF